MSGRGVTLTPHSVLVPSSWKGSAIPLLPLWAVRPVQSLNACTRVQFTFTFFGLDCAVIKLSLARPLNYNVTVYRLITQNEFLKFGIISTLVSSFQHLRPTQSCDKCETATSPRYFKLCHKYFFLYLSRSLSTNLVTIGCRIVLNASLIEPRMRQNFIVYWLYEQGWTNPPSASLWWLKTQIQLLEKSLFPFSNLFPILLVP